MTIGENIRLHRKRLGMTQAQLAEAVGVSVQAVSKWETDSGMPDVVQIIPLARAFSITTDELLGFTDREEEFEQRWKELLRITDDPQQFLELSKAALEECPHSTRFLFRAAMDEKRLADLAEDNGKKGLHLDRARRYALRLLEEDPSDETGRELLVQIYSDLGLNGEAVSLACQCKNRDRALKYCLKGEALRRHRQEIVDRKLQSLLLELMEGGPAMQDAAERIILAAIPDGNFQHYEGFLLDIYSRRAKKLDACGDTEGAVDTLYRLLDLLKAGEGETAFTTPLFSLLTGRQHPPEIPNWVVMVPEEQRVRREDILGGIEWYRTKQK